MNAPGVVCEAQAREVWGEKGELAEQRGRVALGALRADSRWDGRRRCPYPRPLLGSSDERGPPARNLPTTRERRNSLPLRSARPESTSASPARSEPVSRREKVRPSERTPGIWALVPQTKPTSLNPANTPVSAGNRIGEHAPQVTCDARTCLALRGGPIPGANQKHCEPERLPKHKSPLTVRPGG
jgi:hypothetical protein